MAIRIEPAGEPGLVIGRISRLMTLADQKTLEDLARAAIDEGLPARLLVALDGFEGWAPGDGWGDDLQFTADYGNRIQRVAIVGEPRWRDEALAFVGDGFRTTRVRYFPPGEYDDASAWVRA